MGLARLFDILIPSQTKFEVKQKLFNNENQKSILSVIDNNLLEVAVVNKDLRTVLKHYDFALPASKSSHFFLWAAKRGGFLPNFFAKILQLPYWFKVIIFYLLFILQLIYNYILLIITLLISWPYTKITNTQDIYLKHFTFEILKLAQDLGAKIFIFSNDQTADNVTAELLKKLYPRLNISIWDYQTNAVSIVGKQAINSGSVYQRNPMFWELRNYLSKNIFDLVILSTKNIKNNYDFIASLQTDTTVNYKVIGSVNLSTIRDNKSYIFSKLKLLFKNLWFCTVDQFIEAVAKAGAKKILEINIVDRSNNTINIDKKYRRCILKSEEEMNDAVSSMLAKIHKDIELFEPLGASKLKNIERINSTLNDFKKVKFNSVKTRYYIVNLKYLGELGSIQVPHGE